ncbi:winged helix-turn-helix transcriptional regulator [Flavobacteriaceae bacterium Ap0902]|nr:winged helix-turn-helix transcriptional regulator [Flavobacteriaceae bacterium Ap0902]
MASQTKENYIKTIYHLHQKNEEISLSDIGEELGVSKPTVNNMIKKLKEEGFVDYQKYKPIKITPRGKKFAAEIVRRHRLSEMFLTEIMGFGWEEVHEIAEELEHINPEKLFDRMDEMLGYPNVDPHGSPIPDKDGNYTRNNYIPLSKTEIGKKYQVKSLKTSTSNFLMFLNEKEIQLNTIFHVHHIEEFDGNITVSYDNHDRVVLSSTAANKLLVEEIN